MSEHNTLYSYTFVDQESVTRLDGPAISSVDSSYFTSSDSTTLINNITAKETMEFALSELDPIVHIKLKTEPGKYSGFTASGNVTANIYTSNDILIGTTYDIGSVSGDSSISKIIRLPELYQNIKVELFMAGLQMQKLEIFYIGNNNQFTIVDELPNENAKIPNQLNINGLIGWFDLESFNPSSGIWDNKISADATNATTSGTVEIRSSVGTNGANGTFKYLYGTTSTSVTLNATPFDGTTNKEYTFIHISRYHSSTEGRIWQGVGTNYLSGFWSGAEGVYYQQAWIDSNNENIPTSWVLTVDQNVSLGGMIKSTYMSSGEYVTNVYGSQGASLGAMTNLSINAGAYNEKSVFGAALVLMYDRTLNINEITQIEDYLKKVYFEETKPRIYSGINYYNILQNFNIVRVLRTTDGTDAGNDSSHNSDGRNRLECNELQLWIKDANSNIINIAPNGTNYADITRSDHHFSNINNEIIEQDVYKMFIGSTSNSNGGVPVVCRHHFKITLDSYYNINDVAAIVWYSLYAVSSYRNAPGASIQLLHDDRVLYTYEIGSEGNQTNTQVFKVHGPALPSNYIFQMVGVLQVLLKQQIHLVLIQLHIYY